MRFFHEIRKPQKYKEEQWYVQQKKEKILLRVSNHY